VTVNRSLSVEPMDNIDHALGRPVDPMTATFRNFFATGMEQAEQFRASPHWREVAHDVFAVTDAGRVALRDHLRAIGDQHRAFTVTYEGRSWQVVARSRGAARYGAFLDLRDVNPDLTFRGFVTGSRVTS
jgi:hypothetical protein